jgi:hypothetical protein
MSRDVLPRFADAAGVARGQVPGTWPATAGSGGSGGQRAGLAARLNGEWSRLRVAEDSTACVLDWARRCPALGGMVSLPGLEAALVQADAGTRDRMLLALLELARTEELAGRVVLQAMLGKAVRLAGTHLTRQAQFGGADGEEALAVAVAALWQVIRTYPVATRRRRVAANLALETLALVHRGQVGGAVRGGQEVPIADLRVPGLEERVTGGEQVPVDAELVAVLAWAVQQAVITPAEARLLATVYGVDSTGRPMDGPRLAAELGVSWPAVRQRCSRSVRRLAGAVRTQAA